MLLNMLHRSGWYGSPIKTLARGPLLLVLTAALLVGCGSDPEESKQQIQPRYEPAASDFFRVPWPSDHRVLADGTVDLSDFPDAEFPMIASMRASIEGTLVGFSTMPVGYIELDLDPGPEALLSPAQTLDPNSAVQLLALGDHCGERVPIEMQIAQEEGKHIRPRVLQLAPVPGFALRQGVPYAFVVLRSFGAAAGLETARPAAYDELLDGSAEGALADALAPLRSCAKDAPLNLDSVAIATVFTTQDVLGPARALRDAVNDPGVAAAPEISGWAQSDKYTSNGHTSFTATYQTPMFQDGVSPYTQSGGVIHFVDGKPTLQGTEKVPMIITVPDGSGPFPVLMWVDGTGWGQWSHVSSKLSKDLLAAGFAIASYMPQFHGDRATPDSDPATHTYNFLNPMSGRNVLRQQLADAAYFIRVLREAVPKIQGAPQLDTTALVFGGQSQGAQNGALLASVEPEVKAFVLNGLASFLTITILERKDGTDYEALLKVLLGIHIEIDRFYPAIQLMQLGADSVDPHNYARGWRGWSGKPSGANLFVLNGFTDFTTHPLGMNAITIAGDMEVIAPGGWDVDPHGVWERNPAALPISGNRTDYDDKPHTVATYLDAEESHYTIYGKPQERARAVTFLLDALSGMPSLE